MQHILQDLLPTELKLLVDAEMQTLNLFDSEKGALVVQRRLTGNEWTLLMVFEENHPHYAPNEMLLASLTLFSPDVCRKRIYEAQQKGAGAVRKEMKPVYRALSTLRKKLKAIYPPLKISLVRDAGYALRVAPDIGR